MLIVSLMVGLGVGVVLNLLIARLPRRKFPFAWPIRCRYCGDPLPVFEVPAFLAYLIGKGRCRACGRRLELRYVLVELATAVLFGALYYRFGPSLPLFIYGLYACIFVIIFMIDLEHRLILNVVTYPAILLGVLLTFITPGLGGGQGLLGGLFYGGLFMGMYVLAMAIYRQVGALGFGDVKLALLIGLITGLQGAIIAALIGTLIGALLAVWLMVFGRTSSKAAMPYGPALSLGAVVTMIWSPWVG